MDVYKMKEIIEMFEVVVKYNKNSNLITSTAYVNQPLEVVGVVAMERENNKGKIASINIKCRKTSKYTYVGNISLREIYVEVEKLKKL